VVTLRTHRFHVVRTADAPVEVVWAVVSDHAGWSSWTALPSSELEREGAVERDGVGAIRAFRTGRWVTREEVTVFQPPDLMTYRLVSGLPGVRRYESTVRLAPHGAGTRIEWSGELQTVPGAATALWWLCSTVVRSLATRAAHEAERRRERR
jgi:hypothetical protein